jgi:hypothetical protein
MAVIGSGVATLVDVLKEVAPDGSALDTAEVLTQHTEVLLDMSWMEGNLITGHRDSVRTVLPEPSYRALNEGVPITKGATTPIEETCAMLEDWSQADRELAILSGNVDRFRLRKAREHQIGFAHKLARDVFYGNARANPRGFTGLAPRFNTLNPAVSATASQVLNAGGTGTNLRSIYLIGWSEETVTGLYPKGTKGGLLHHDATTPSAGQINDGFAPGMPLLDANGNRYQGFLDHWIWRCGLMVKDWRYVVRIANIDLATLSANQSTGANLQNLMIQAMNRIESLDGVRAAWYMPRFVQGMLQQQLVEKKNAFLSLTEVGGSTRMDFGQVPIRRTDALNVNETQVTA